MMEASSERAGPASAPARPPQSLWPDLTGIHAFVVEDNADTRIMVGETLQHCGAVVTTFQSADAAIAHLAECLPAIFICDLSMPGLDGLQFMRRVRAQPPERGGELPAIAITAYYEDFVSAAALEAGFNAYMMKPIRLETLCRLVQRLTTGSP
jgi:CheY-like chemotaxis protein